MSPNTEESREVDLQINNAQELKQHRRQTNIMDQWEEFQDMLTKAWEYYSLGDIHHDARCIMCLKALQNAIRSIWDLGAEGRQEEQNKYWNNTDPNHALGRIEFESKDDIWFMDLADIHHAQEYYSDIWFTEEKRRHGPDETVERTEQKVVPLNVITNGYNRLTMFLSKQEQVIELQLEEQDDSLTTWGFEVVEEEGDETDDE